MRIIYLLTLLFCSSTLVFGQNQLKIDSLNSVLNTDITNQNKVKIYNFLASEYVKVDSQKVAQYTTKATQLAKSISYQEGISDALYQMGSLNQQKGHHRSAIRLFEQSLETAKKANYQEGVAQAFQGIGSSHMLMSNYPESFRYYTQALQLLEKIGNPSSLALIYDKVGRLISVQGKYPEALKYFNKAVAINLKKNNQKHLATNYGQMGVVFARQGNFPKAREYFEQALAMKNKVGDKAGAAKLYMNIGNIYGIQGNYPKSIEYQFKALKVEKQLGEQFGIAQIYTNLGNLYGIQQNFDESLKYFKLSLKIAKKINFKEGVAINYVNLGQAYYSQDKKEEAEQAFKASLQISKAIGNPNGVAASLLMLGKINLVKQKHAIAKEYFEKALALRQKMGERDMSAALRVALGAAYFMQKDYKLAHFHLNKGIQSALHTGNPLIVKDGAEYLSKVYEATGDYKKSLENYQLFKKMTDSVLNGKNIREITRLENKQREDSLRLSQSKEKALLNAEIKQRKTTQNATYLGLGLSALLILVLAMFYWEKQKHNRKLNTANTALGNYNNELKTVNERIHIAHEEIKTTNESLQDTLKKVEEQRDDIVSSITYAQRIQQAILPIESKLNTALPEHFILFRPRDVVSGDFYWFEEIGHKQFIIVGDCTGHGVPGAFMTMLGVQALNNIILQKQIHSPAQILEELHHTTRAMLHIQNTQVDDGMDIVICVVDKNTQTLEFAGAKNPLVIVQNNELRHIRGDRFGINGYHLSGDKVTFTNHRFDLTQPTTIYLYSDGYQDQFGGPQGRKFLKKQLNDLLLEISTQPITQQKQILENTLDNWIQDGHQIDDILIMGVKTGMSTTS